MRSYVLARRWIPWHILCLIVTLAMLRLGLWQFSVASAPHPAGASVQAWRNYAYGINWFIFAVVAVWFWWRFMRDQRTVELAREAEEAEAAAADDRAKAAKATPEVTEGR